MASAENQARAAFWVDGFVQNTPQPDLDATSKVWQQVVQAYSHLVGLGKLLARLNLPYRLMRSINFAWYSAA
ncbi:MAG TPA: hypothetical protein VKC60_16540 [Opitutaceae bacterium]|nr:hypothetical protein [Opitutaceae bacterium]